MIVFTNGCFDLLHVGHIDLLTQCREIAGPNGSVVVGLNSDFSIEYLKPDLKPSRPIIKEIQRKLMLESLRMVDRVELFDTETGLIELLRTIKPDMICKGEEYTGYPITGSDEFPVRLLPRRIKCSTTDIINRIYNL